MSIAPPPPASTSTAPPDERPEPAAGPVMPEPVPDAPMTETTPASRWVALLLLALAAASTAGWLALRRWYGLYETGGDPHFSFERIRGGFDSPTMRQTLYLLLGISAAWAVPVLALGRWRPPARLAWLALAALVGGPAIANVLLYPVGALDVFNYMIELKLTFHYDKNPYLVTFWDYRADSYAGPAFLTKVTLFYGPAWLLASGVPAVLAGFDDLIRTLVALKVFNLGLIALTAAAIAFYHRDSRQRWLAVALFAANPLVLFEGVGNGHNDVLLTAFAIPAMLALQRRSPLAGPLLALAALVKLYAAALAPIFIVVALRERWGWKRIGLTVALTALTVAATCAPYWGEGKLVDGLRAGLEESQEMDHVSPLSLARQYAQDVEAHNRYDTGLALSRPSFEIVPQATQDAIDRGFTAAFLLAVAVIAIATWRGHPPALAAAETLLVLYLLMTNLYGWYLIPVFALLALHPDRLSRAYVLVATALGLAYYPMFVYAHYNSGWSRFHIHQFLALFLTLPIVLFLLARLMPWGWLGALRHRVGFRRADRAEPAAA